MGKLAGRVKLPLQSIGKLSALHSNTKSTVLLLTGDVVEDG